MNPKFIYQKYSYKIRGGNMEISFVFKMEPENIYFHPRLTVKRVTGSFPATLDNLVFHLGLMEVPSYWKAALAPEIVVEAGYLNGEQVKWWQDLIVKGMSQFFYENKLSWQKPQIISMKKRFLLIAEQLQGAKRPVCKEGGRGEPCDRYLVPMGGGRDSIVTLEKLRAQGKNINCFVVNPTKAAKNVLKIAGIKKPIVVERKIDPKLLELNKKGYLNGHTPFTAVLSFLSVFCAVLFGYKNIVFSNEKSADEGNVKYLGKVVNHQYSKTSEFERKFKNYCKKYLVKNINYFSFLRKYSELEISRMFTKYPKYLSVFSSCNIAGKMGPPATLRYARVAKRAGDRWCGDCPKCLFVYLTLCPYLEKKRLLKIFGENLLKKQKLLPVLKSLMGQGSHKPFECVGTYSEAKKALKLCLKKG